MEDLNVDLLCNLSNSLDFVSLVVVHYFLMVRDANELFHHLVLVFKDSVKLYLDFFEPLHFF